MVLEEVAQVPANVLLEAGRIALWLQTLGVITLLLVLSGAINIVLNFRRKRKLNSIERKLTNIEKILSKK